MIETLLRLPAVMEVTALSKTAIYELQSKGQFPQARRLTRRCVAWVGTEVQAWIASRDLAKR